MADNDVYRDEREVLRDEVRSLRHDLERAQVDQRRLVELEQELAVTRRRLTAFESESFRRIRPGVSATFVVAAVALGVLVVAGTASFVLLRRSARPPSVTTPVETASAARKSTPEGDTTAVPPPMPPPERPAAHPRWRATVVKVAGLPIVVGSACSIEAALTENHDEKPAIDVNGVIVRCGTTVIYDAQGKLEGSANRRWGAEQHPGEKGGTWTYALVYSDVGSRGPTRNQVMLDSTKELGKVWSDNLPEFRVDLALLPKSEPTEIAVHEP